ncbi:MAG: class I SAM-dependent methyltransferase [Pirellulaceae bacterium]|nr:class I SAM-dependent methyltransferase [Pirellulaceae bacterium]
MITPRSQITATDVSRHYDDLDPFYRRLWGDHVHHGLWLNGRETPDQAVEQLVDLVAKHLGVSPGDQVCDVGCGYGAAARYLARVHGADVTGVTISKTQFDHAQQMSRDGESPRFLLQNWESNTFRSESFEGIVSIECLAHIENKEVFFREIQRVLRPGRRAVITAWLAGETARRWENRHLLEPICREGRLPGMGTEREYVQLLQDVGLHLVEFQDLSLSVRKTWRICARRVLALLLTSRDAWRFLLKRQSADSIFLVTVWRILMAYRTGAMRYGLFVMEKSE